MWDNIYTVLYMPEGSYPDIDFPELFGDFNADNTVNYQDAWLLGEHWLASIDEPNNYDLLYEEPNSFNGVINLGDFAAFADNWNKVYDPNSFDPNE